MSKLIKNNCARALGVYLQASSQASKDSKVHFDRYHDGAGLSRSDWSSHKTCDRAGSKFRATVGSGFSLNILQIKIKRPQQDGLLNGPQVNPEEKTDVVANQSKSMISRQPWLLSAVRKNHVSYKFYRSRTLLDPAQKVLGTTHLGNSAMRGWMSTLPRLMP